VYGCYAKGIPLAFHTGTVLPLILSASSKHCLPAITLKLVSYLQFIRLMVFAYFGSPLAWSIDYQIFILN